MSTDTESPFTVVGAAEYDAATDTLTPLEEPNRWESAGKLTAPEGYRREYRDAL
jgi:hypothetical protein